jgi:hypothetical protein
MGLPGLYWNMGGPKEKEKKAQLIQYESIKTELKQEYEKKLSVLRSRLTQRATKDPSFWLFNQMASEGEKKSTSVNSGANSIGSLSSSGGFWKQNSGRNFASGDRNSKA